MKISGTIAAALVALLSNSARAQTADAAAILARDAAIDAHLVKARVAAGFDFTGTLARLCVAPATFPLVVRDAAPSGRVPARDTWFALQRFAAEYVGGPKHDSLSLHGATFPFARPKTPCPPRAMGRAISQQISEDGLPTQRRGAFYPSP